jgi:hypothetical protein
MMSLDVHVSSGMSVNVNMISLDVHVSSGMSVCVDISPLEVCFFCCPDYLLI